MPRAPQRVSLTHQMAGRPSVAQRNVVADYAASLVCYQQLETHQSLVQAVCGCNISELKSVISDEQHVIYIRAV